MHAIEIGNTNLIVATAGHIDHGKSLLVRALTGTDTDRLPEEKARGISIDLGFAYLPLPSGELIAFVDVPGHERFVRNMLAGVCGVDLALLVVAADDGVMPQTLEHLNILKLLGVSRGAVVITKIDRVDSGRVETVRRETEALVLSTFRTAWSVFPVSSPAGVGLVELRNWLAREAAASARAMEDHQLFRFAVDRAFVVKGSGIVVTGTVFNGAVTVGDHVLASGSGREVRVRTLQIHGSSAERAVAGQRCAINVSGSEAQRLARGDWLMHPSLHYPSNRFDVRVVVLDGEPRALKHWTPVHVHLGSAETTGRVAVRAGKAIEPGCSAFAQLILDRPLGALCGDRFILRDQSATRTLGGGVVLDPFAEPLRRRDAVHEEKLAALESGTPREILGALAAASPAGVQLQRFGRAMDLTPETLEALCGECGLVVLGQQARTAVTAAKAEELMAAVVSALSLGTAAGAPAHWTAERLRRVLCPAMDSEPFHDLVDRMQDAGRIELRAGALNLPGASIESYPQESVIWPRVESAVRAQGFMPLTPHHLALELGVEEKLLLGLLGRRMRAGDLVKVADRFYLRSTLAQLAAVARALAQQEADGVFTVADFRDASGASRRAVIKILECFDSFGITRRTGDGRRLGKGFADFFGGETEIVKSGPGAALPEKAAILEICA